MLVRPLVIVLAPTGRPAAAPAVLALPAALLGSAVVRSSASLATVLPSNLPPLSIPSPLSILPSTSILVLASMLLPVAILRGPDVSRTLVGLPRLLATLFRPLPVLAVSSIGLGLASRRAVDALGWWGLVLSRPVIVAAFALLGSSSLAAELAIGVPFAPAVLLAATGFPILLVAPVLGGPCPVGGMLFSLPVFSLPRIALLTGSIRSTSLRSRGARMPPVTSTGSLPCALVALGSLAAGLAVLGSLTAGLTAFSVAALPTVSLIASVVAPVLLLPASRSPLDRATFLESAGSPWLLALSWDVRVHCGNLSDRYPARAGSPIGALCPSGTPASTEKRPLHAPDGTTWGTEGRGGATGRTLEIDRRREIAPERRAPPPGSEGTRGSTDDARIRPCSAIGVVQRSRRQSTDDDTASSRPVRTA